MYTEVEPNCREMIPNSFPKTFTQLYVYLFFKLLCKNVDDFKVVSVVAHLYVQLRRATHKPDDLSIRNFLAEARAEAP